jgi:hypothetical protein
MIALTVVVVATTAWNPAAFSALTKTSAPAAAAPQASMMATDGCWKGFAMPNGDANAVLSNLRLLCS